MELVNASLTTSPLRGRCLSVNEALIKLVPSESSRKALSTFCLLGKVVAPMTVSEANAVDFVAKAWKFPVTVVALSEGPTFINCFELSFAREEDRWALDHGPWCIRGYSFFLQVWSPTNVSPVKSDMLRTWVQVHNMPHDYFSKANGHLLGGKAGSVIHVDLQEDNPSSWGKYLKVLIEIDIKYPLFSGCFFDLDTGVRKWLQFKYEQIGIFCYYCGCLGHQRRGCKLSSPIMVTSDNGTLFPLYGPWLSTSSTYLDVFSSANSFLPCRDHSSSALYPPFRRPLRAAGNIHGVDGGAGKSVPNVSRGSRCGRMVTRRCSSNGGIAQRAVWISKPKPAGDGTPVAISGIEGGVQAETNGKAPVGLPGIVPPITIPTNDRSLNDEPHLNKANKGGNIDSLGRSLHASLQEGGPVSSSGPDAMRPSGYGPSKLNEKAIYCSDLVENVVRESGGLLIGGPSDTNGNGKLLSLGPDYIISSGPVNAHEPQISNGLEINKAPLVKCDKDIITTSSGNGAEKNFEEKKALSQFFKAQEELLHDLKHFGKLDLYEIKSLGGDIGVPPSSETNERTTPFKKRKFEGSASLCSRPHKLVRTYHGVVRDFPWDTKKRIHETRAEVDDLSEEPSSESSSCNFGVNRNHLLGSFVIEDSGSSLSVRSSNPVEENVKSPPQAP
uniref:CCHC-type domain-containing protein n=1 Tax=Cannabis sativa TaxID=3483 RepID=A0A803P9D5_CANSA